MRGEFHVNRRLHPGVCCESLNARLHFLQLTDGDGHFRESASYRYRQDIAKTKQAFGAVAKEDRVWVVYRGP